MATGINEKSKQNPRFLYSSDRSKNVLRVRSRPVGLQPPLTASTISTEVGDGKQYGSSRDFTAATGLVPRQYSTGGRTTLLGISKRGNKKIRTLLLVKKMQTQLHFAHAQNI